MQFARPLPGHHAFCILLAICPPNWGSCPLGGAGEIGGGMTLEQLVEHYLKQVLTQTRRALDAAEILGVDQAEIYRKKRNLSSKMRRKLAGAVRCRAN